MRRLIAASVLLLGCSGVSDAPTAPSLRLNQSVESRGYIVVLKSGSPPSNARHVYSHVFKGFSADLDPSEVESLRHNPNVKSVSEEHDFTTSGSWGIDRIDQRQLPLDSSYSSDRTGQGVTAYIVDTGIRYTHSEFQGRAVKGFDINKSDASDCVGHGTHVSGTVGGITYGVAHSVALVSVKVFPDCTTSTPTSDILAGLDWIVKNRSLPCVVNMSLGGSADPALDLGVQGVVDAGCTVVVSAGNSNADACTQSPARVQSALTVGATTSTDFRASYSNWGSCVDLFAPGSAIISAWYTGDTNTANLSGTSMASPHVTGVAALYLEGRPNASPSEVSDSIKAYSTKGVVQNSLTANWNLLYSGREADNSDPGPPPMPPAPNAPSGLSVRVVEYQSGRGQPVLFHFDWTDNSDDEVGFLVIGHATNGDYTQRVATLNATSLEITDGSGVWTFYVVAYRFIDSVIRIDSPPSNLVTISACQRRCK